MRTFHSERGATIIEYALLSCLALMLLLPLQLIGRGSASTFDTVSFAMNDGGGSATSMRPPHSGMQCDPGDICNGPNITVPNGIGGIHGTGGGNGIGGNHHP